MLGYNYASLPDRFSKTQIKLGHGWVITPHFNVDVIIYPCSDLTVGLADFCQ